MTDYHLVPVSLTQAIAIAPDLTILVWDHDGRPVTFPWGADLIKAAVTAPQRPPLRTLSGGKARKLAANERWITIHPHGDDEPGQPVLIRMNADGTASIVAGAGGRLNALRLDHVKSDAEYRAQAKERKEERQAAHAEARAGLSEGERNRQDDLMAGANRKKIEHLIDYVVKVGPHFGMTEDQLTALIGKQRGDDKITSLGLGMARANQIKAVASQLQKRVAAVKQELLENHEKAAELGFGDVPLEEVPSKDKPSAAHVLDPEKVARSGAKGYQDEARKIAEQHGLSKDELSTEKQDVAISRTVDRMSENEGYQKHVLRTLGVDPKDQHAVEQAHATFGGDHGMARAFLAKARADMQAAHAVREGAKTRYEGLTPKGEAETGDAHPLLQDTSKLMDVLQADSELKRNLRQQQRVAQAANEGKISKAYQLQAEELDEPDVIQQLMKDRQVELDRKAYGALLARSEDLDSLGKHLATGAYSAINNAALVTTGQSFVPRETADLLGAAGTAQLTAWHLHRALTPDQMKDVAEGIAQHHAATNRAIANRAFNQSQGELDAAAGIRLGSADNPMDLAIANQLNHHRLTHLEEARRIVGTALGKLEGMAALSKAIHSRPVKELSIPVAGTIESAITHARALGLAPDDYQVHSQDAENQFLTIKGGGLAKLVQPEDAEAQRAARAANVIKRGDADEEGWLPEGIVNRPVTSIVEPTSNGEPEVTADTDALEHARSPEAMRAALESFIGKQRAAGRDARDIAADVSSLPFTRQVTGADPGREATWAKVRDAVVPADYKGKKLVQAFDALARQQGGGLVTQTLDGEPEALTHAAFNAINAVPAGSVAFKAPRDLTPQDKLALREAYLTHLAGVDPAEERKQRDEARQNRQEDAEHARQAMGLGIFGDIPAPPASAPDGDEQELPTTWNQFVTAMGGTHHALRAVQDHLRGQVVHRFAAEHAAMGAAPLQLGQQKVHQSDRFKEAAGSPERTRQYLERVREQQQQGQARTGSGQYAGGGRAIEENTQRLQQLGGSLFDLKDVQPQAAGPDLEHRATLGPEAEKHLAEVANRVGRAFDPRKGGVTMHPVSMSGKFAKQQRAIKLLDRVHRLGLHFGAGSGKTLTDIGAFTHLFHQGKVDKAIMAVPSVVQAQYGSEMLRYTDPTKGYKWFAKPGANLEERLAALKDPNTHMVVLTHAGLRDTLLHAWAQHEGMDPDHAPEAFGKLDREQKQRAMHDTLAHLGIDPGKLLGVVDEAHDLSNRKGKENSQMADVIDSAFAPAGYAMYQSGTPVKNDPSEVYDWLTKVRPDRYPPQRREDFIRRYGLDTEANREALQREVAPYFYADKIPSGAPRTDKDHVLPLTSWQKGRLQEIDRAYTRAKKQGKAGHVDVEALKAIDPRAFQDLSAEEQREVGEGKLDALGLVKNAGIKRTLNMAPPEHNAKIQHLVKLATGDHRGEPGVIFAHNLEAVHHIARALRDKGIRTGVLTGEMSSEDKAKARLGFNPEGDKRPTSDVLVVSDAGATGMNLQRGKWLAHYDVPDTAKNHEQRTARIDRLGQKQAITVHNLMADHPLEQRARQRLGRKYELGSIFQSPTEALDDTGLAHAITQARARRLGWKTLAKAAGAVQVDRPDPLMTLLAIAAR